MASARMSATRRFRRMHPNGHFRARVEHRASEEAARLSSVASESYPVDGSELTLAVWISAATAKVYRSNQQTPALWTDYLVVAIDCTV